MVLTKQAQWYGYTDATWSNQCDDLGRKTNAAHSKRRTSSPTAVSLAPLQLQSICVVRNVVLPGGYPS